MHREDYCKTAILFEVLDGNVTFSYENHKVTLNKRDLLVINKGTEYQYDASEDIILASPELMGSTFESVCDGVKQSVICNSVNGDSERYDALRAILRQMILNQAYVADNEEEYAVYILSYEECCAVIDRMRFGDESDLSGKEKDDSHRLHRKLKM